MSQVPRFYEEAGQGISIIVGDGKIRLEFRQSDSMMPVTRAFLTNAGATEDVSAAIEVIISSKVLMGGPKVFRISDLASCLALEQVQPNLTLDEYVQPYPTMVVELPEAYTKARRIENGSSPLGVFLHWQKDEYLLYNVPFSSGMSVVGSITTVNGKVLEDCLVSNKITEYTPDEHYEASEKEVVHLAARVAINSMLLLMQQGCKRLGADNKAYEEKLRSHLAKAQKRKQGVKDAQERLRQLPIYYGFAQEIQLFREEREDFPAQSDTHSGVIVRPHWRRGHFRMQPFGQGRSERKRIFVSPFLINRHLLAGNESTTRVTYNL